MQNASSMVTAARHASSASAAVAATPHDRLDAAIARSQAAFLRQQHREGYWHAPLEANVSMDAQYLFLNRFMGRQLTRIDRRIVDHMLATQRDDGSWPLYAGGPGHLSDTIEAYFALKLAGLSADEPALVRARDFIRAHGGLAKAGVFTRTFLAYFGQFPWAALPAMPVELMLLPPWFPHQHLRDVELGARDGRAAHRADGASDRGSPSRRTKASRSCGCGRRPPPISPSRAAASGSRGAISSSPSTRP